jgi:hypothetical protein
MLKRWNIKVYNINFLIALFPIYAKITNSKVEFIKSIPKGSGFMFGDGAFDAKPVLNTIASKGYLSMIKKDVTNPKKLEQE